MGSTGTALTAMNWREAYASQAHSDYAILLLFMDQGRDVPHCHRLHYLQMATEKMGKAFLTKPNGTRYPSSHDAFVRFIRSEIIRARSGQNELMQACGFQRVGSFIAHLNSLLPTAQTIEDLSPEGFDHPNPEYPWEAGGAIYVPQLYPFADLYFDQNPLMTMLRFVASCFSIL